MRSYKELSSGPQYAVTLAHGNTPLFNAAYEGDLAELRRLLESKAEVNQVDKWGQTPLLCAAYQGHTQVLEALIAAKAIVNTKDAAGRTPLSWAVKNSYIQAAQVLLKNKANIHIQGQRFETPLSLAESQKDPVMLRLLRENDSTLIKPQSRFLPELTRKKLERQQRSAAAGMFHPKVGRNSFFAKTAQPELLNPELNPNLNSDLFKTIFSLAQSCSPEAPSSRSPSPFDD